MVSSKKKSFFLIILLLVAVGIGLLYWYSGLLVNQVVRPALLGLIKSYSGLECTVDRITPSFSGLVLKDLSVHRDDQFSLSVPRAEVNFSLEDIKSKKIRRLVLVRPKLIWNEQKIEEKQDETNNSPSSSPPLEEIIVEDGSFAYNSESREISINRLKGKFHLKEGDFQLSAVLAQKEGISFNLRSKGQWLGREIKLKTFELDQLEFLSPDESKAVSGGSLWLSGDFDLKNYTFDLAAKGSAQEILYDTFYSEPGGQEVQLNLTGEMKKEDLLITFKESRIVFPGIGRLSFAGNYSPADFAIKGTAELKNLQVSQKQFKKLLADIVEGIEEVDFSGDLSAEIDLTRKKQHGLVEAVFQPKSLSVLAPLSNLSVKDLSGYLPLKFELWGTGWKDNKQTRPGNFSFADIKYDSFSLDPGILKFTSSLNKIAVFSPLSLTYGQGKISVGNFTFVRQGGEPSFEAKVQLQKLRLEDLVSDQEAFPVKGEIDGDLGQISYTAGILKTRGQARLDIFGGEVIVTKIMAENLFDPYRTFTGDIQLSGIDLYKLTRAFSFGDMHGVVDGEVKGLKLFGLVPESFKAKLESRTGGKRRISVKALNNLSIISQGEAMAALSRGIYSFIDTYRYQKIGIECSLKNDVFELYGTAIPDSRKYIIYGGVIPPKLDMITYNPKISFKEMLKRLGRIKRTE